MWSAFAPHGAEADFTSREVIVLPLQNVVSPAPDWPCAISTCRLELAGGLWLALVAGRSMDALLFGVTFTDRLSFLVVLMLVISLGIRNAALRLAGRAAVAAGGVARAVSGCGRLRYPPRAVPPS